MCLADFAYSDVSKKEPDVPTEPDEIKVTLFQFLISMMLSLIQL